MTHANGAGASEQGHAFIRTRHFAFCMLVVADAASVVLHGASPGNAMLIPAAAALLTPGQTAELVHALLDRRPYRRGARRRPRGDV